MRSQWEPTGDQRTEPKKYIPLTMRRPDLDDLPRIPILPEGYILRAYQEGDAPSLAATLCSAFDTAAWRGLWAYRCRMNIWSYEPPCYESPCRVNRVCLGGDILMLRVGVVGLRRGLSFVKMASLHPQTRPVAVCDLDERKVKAVKESEGLEAGYTDYERFLEHDMDIVVLATPIPDHVPQAVAALGLDKHVLSEVTAVYSLDECEVLISAVEKSKGKYMMAENCCFWAFIESWGEMARQGRLGEIIYAEAEYIHDVRSLMKDEKGQVTWRARRPPIHYCTHSLGPLLQIMNDRCISAMGLHTGSKIWPEVGNIDMEVGIFKTQKGAVIKILRGAAVCREPAFHYYSIYGTNGCLETRRPGGEDGTLAYFEDIPNLHGMLSIPLNIIHPRVGEAARVGGHGTADYVMFDSFVRSILDDTTPVIDVYRALDFTVPGICAHISAEGGGKPVEVPSFRKQARG